MPPVRMIRRAIESIAGVLLLSLLANPASAGVVTYRLGEQDYASGAGPILVSAAASAGSDEAAPFGGDIFGDDRRVAFGRLRFSYQIPVATTGDGSLMIGLIGLDSPPGAESTVKLFLDGIRQPNDAFAGVSSPLYPSSASVVTIPVPAALLADGELEVLVKAFRHGPGYPGNAISADFSALTVLSTQTTPGGQNGGNPDNPDDGTGGDPDDGSGGGGGGTVRPPPSVPLPPAIWAGSVGLLLTALIRKKVCPR